MRKTLWPLVLGTSLILSSLAVVACGDDDTNGSSSGTGTSSGTSGTGTSGTSGTSGSSGTSGVPEGGTSSGCTFAGFVTNLINTQTTAAALPSTDLGEKCTESTSQDDFAGLFK